MALETKNCASKRKLTENMKRDEDVVHMHVDVVVHLHVDGTCRSSAMLNMRAALDHPGIPAF